MTEDKMAQVFQLALDQQRVREVWFHLQAGGDVRVQHGVLGRELRFDSIEGHGLSGGMRR